MHYRIEVWYGRIRLLDEAFETINDGSAWIVGCGQSLAGKNYVAIFIHQDEIGEGAADIDADADPVSGFVCHSSPLLSFVDAIVAFREVRCDVSVSQVAAYGVRIAVFWPAISAATAKAKH